MIDPQAKNETKAVAALYDDAAKRYDDLIVKTGYIGPEWLLTHYSDRIKEEPIAMLDLGCANGVNALNLRQINPQVTAVGLDISPKMVKAAKACGAYRQVIEQTLDLPLPFESTSFDLIVVLGCLEFVNDINHVIDEMTRVARRNGELYATFQHHDPERTSAPRQMRSGAVSHHAYTEEEVVDFVERRGWAIEHREITIGYTGGYPCPYHCVKAQKR